MPLLNGVLSGVRSGWDLSFVLALCDPRLAFEDGRVGQGGYGNGVLARGNIAAGYHYGSKVGLKITLLWTSGCCGCAMGLKRGQWSNCVPARGNVSANHNRR